MTYRTRAGDERNGVSSAAFFARAARLAFAALRERRLPLSPSRWLLDLRHLRGEMNTGRGALPDGRRRRIRGDVKDTITRAAMTELLAFLETNATLTFVHHDAPTVSVLLVLYNRAELTFRCIRALLSSSVPLQLVIVDNASTDLTHALLERLRGAVIVRNDVNAGFGAGVNSAAAHASGRYLLMLNNDAEVLPGGIEAAVRRIDSDPAIGAVGGKLILPDGRLQEAGTIVWRDGTCLGYGRDDDPMGPSYAFARDVDFCSGAFLLTPRALFDGIGGFDRAFDPAYYEDADYCATLWERGRRVVYEPEAVAIHFEFASSGSLARARQMQAERRQVFLKKHQGWLQTQPPADPERLHAARHRTAGRRVLVFDDRVPHVSAGFGFPRAVALLRHLTELGHFVTFYPLSTPSEAWASVYEDIPRTVEVMIGYGPERVRAFLAARRGYYDTIIVSRFHNMQRLRARLGDVSEWGAHVIYDAEAISALRDVERERVAGRRIDTVAVQQAIQQEIDLATGTDAVLTVSDGEGEAFRAAGPARIVVLRHSCPLTPTPAGFEARTGFLFVGAFDLLSPNADSVLWFARDVLPLVRARTATGVPFVVAGQNPPADVTALAGPDVRVLSSVANLTPIYDAARVFVAPTRWAAGIPLKIVHAAAHGVPVVCTTLLARQLGWTDGVELLTADMPAAFADACLRLHSDADLWARLRAAALQRVGDDYSPSTFRAALRAALDATHLGDSQRAGKATAESGAK